MRSRGRLWGDKEEEQQEKKEDERRLCTVGSFIRRTVAVIQLGDCFLV